MAIKKITPQYNEVQIEVPGSTANLGLYFDRAGAALLSPRLKTSLKRKGSGLSVQATSSLPTPQGLKRGYSGLLALKRYLKENGLPEQGLELQYEEITEHGFPVGGSGLSGAESVGAVLTAAIYFNQSPTINEVISASAKGEPGEHPDNVAASVMGGIVFISDMPHMSEKIFEKIPSPENLGLVHGFSSHHKEGGTAFVRGILEKPVNRDILINQVGRGVIGALALTRGDVATFLNVVWLDGFHEPRRAEARHYGNFSADELASLKKILYTKYQIGLTISGAGPNMLFWYDKKKYPKGIKSEILLFISSWFATHGITLRPEEAEIANSGAFQEAVKKYPESLLATLRTG